MKTSKTKQNVVKGVQMNDLLQISDLSRNRAVQFIVTKPQISHNTQTAQFGWNRSRQLI